MNDIPDSLLLHVHGQICVIGVLVRIVDTSEVSDRPSSCTSIHASSICLLRVLQARRDMDKEEAAELLNGLPSIFASRIEWRDRSCNNRGTGLCELCCHEGDTRNVDIAVLLCESEFQGKFVSDIFAQK